MTTNKQLVINKNKIEFELDNAKMVHICKRVNNNFVCLFSRKFNFKPIGEGGEVHLIKALKYENNAIGRVNFETFFVIFGVLLLGAK